MDTVELRKKLHIIKNYLQSATNYANSCVQVFQDIKPEILNPEEDYDFEDFKDSVLFDKAEKENINKENAIDRHFKFLKMQSNLKETMKIVDENRTQLYQEFMSKMKNISHEIDALSSVYSFLKYWDEKATDNYELKDYPEKFLKCLKKVPSSCRGKLLKDLTKIKSLPGKNNKSDDSNERISDFVISPYQSKELLESSKRVSSDTTFNSTLMKNIECKKDNFMRGNTMKLGISVMDFTMCQQEGKLNEFRQSSSDTNNESFDMKDVGDLNASVASNDILNQAIHDIEDDIEEDAKPRSVKNHNFSVIDSSNPEMDSDDYPEIERVATTPEVGFNSFDITFEPSINVSFPLKINDSLKLDDEDSVSYMSEGRSRRLNETEFSAVDLSNCNYGYSFNNNSNVKLQHLDDDEELDG